MKKLVWIPGPPTKDGFYWFDSGLRMGDGKKAIHPLLIQVRDGHRWGFGPYGSGPFEGYYYCQAMEKKCKHASVPAAKKWSSTSIVKENNTYGWFKDSDGWLGFAIISPDVHDEVYGTWVYADNPSQAATHGHVVYNNEGWEFCPVKVPEI